MDPQPRSRGFRATRRAASLAQAALRKHRNAPAFLAVLCGIELHCNQARKAARLCDKAIAGWDETMLAHFFAGQAQSASKNRARAVTHLKRVIELEPSDETSWRLLARLYEKAGDETALGELRARFQQQFGSALGQ